MDPIPLLWLCGPPGVGKSAVGWEVYSQSARLGAPVAYMDVDQAGICYPAQVRDPDRHQLKARVVADLRASFAAAGARLLVVSGVVDATVGPDTSILAGPVTTVVLRAGPDEIRARLAARPGAAAAPEDLERQFREIGAHAAALDGSRFTRRVVDTTGRSIDEIALDIMANSLPPVPAERPDHRPPFAQLGPRSAPGEVLWLAGPTGVGKSTIGFRVYLDVVAAGSHASYIDLDQIGFCSPPADHGVRARNLAAVWANHHRAGARVLVVVGPVTSWAEARHYQRAIPQATITWCRLHADRLELTRRILTRGSGGSWAQPGDPLKGKSTSELLQVAERSVAQAQAFENHGIGLRIPVDDLSPPAAATLIRHRLSWPPPPHL